MPWFYLQAEDGTHRTRRREFGHRFLQSGAALRGCTHGVALGHVQWRGVQACCPVLCLEHRKMGAGWENGWDEVGSWALLSPS